MLDVVEIRKEVSYKYTPRCLKQPLAQSLLDLQGTQ